MPIYLEKLFPYLKITNYKITSPKTKSYNCIAYSFEDNTKWWWPNNNDYWPKNLPREETLDAFVMAYKFKGYEDCYKEEYEFGYKKVAIYSYFSGVPTHAARQLPNGKWTSKIGGLEDIEHELDALNGKLYGGVAILLKKRLNFVQILIHWVLRYIS